MKPAAGSAIHYPLLSMWIRPRSVIRGLVTARAPLATLVLAAFAGIYVTLLLVATQAPGLGVVPYRLYVGGLGALAGVAGLHVAGALAFLVGRLLGGTAGHREIRRTLAWTAIPNSLGLTLLAVLGTAASALGSLLSPSNAGASDGSSLYALMLLLSPLGFWGMFVSIRAVGAVQNFGVFRSALNLVLAGGVLWYPVQLLGTELHARFPSFVMPNDAMLPTLARSERFLLDASHTIERGDVVLFARKRNHPHYGVVTDYYVKRVVGVSGDEISMPGGVIGINGEPVKRERHGDFVVTAENGPRRVVPRFSEVLPNGVVYDVLDSGSLRTIPGAPLIVPADHYFVLGDNRDNTEDSPDTYQGLPAPVHGSFVRRDRLVGKALVPDAKPPSGR